MYKITILNTDNGLEITRNYTDAYFSNDPVAIGSDIQEMWDGVRVELNTTTDEQPVKVKNV